MFSSFIVGVFYIIFIYEVYVMMSLAGAAFCCLLHLVVFLFYSFVLGSWCI